MLKNYFLLFGWFLVGNIGLTAWAQKRDVTLADVWQTHSFYQSKSEDLKWMKDDNFYSEYSADKGLVKISITDLEKKAQTLLEPSKVTDSKGRKLNVAGFFFSEDESKVVFLSDRQSVYRRSFNARVCVYDLKAGKMIYINGEKPVRLPTLSSDGNLLGYVENNNLYFTDLNTETVLPVTSDGVNNKIINGTVDWVYEEEFGFTQGFEFSPDGNKIAFFRQDESNVREFVMMMYGSLYPSEYRFKYPKAGEKNSLTEIFIYDRVKKTTVKVDVGPETDQYIARMKWTPAGKLALMRLNRLQNRLDVLTADAETGASAVLFTETNPAYITEPTDRTWHFLPSGKMIYQSEKSGYNHLYLYDLNTGKELNQITSGKWDVTAFYGADEKTETVFYQSVEESPTERNIYSIRFDGKKKTTLTPAKGWHQAKFSSGMNYFMDDYSDANTPWTTTVYNRKGEKISVSKDNTDLKARIEQFNVSPKTFFTFKESGTEFYGWMIKPLNYDPAKKYPVLMYVYGGPGSQEVQNEYDSHNFFWYQTLAAKGYVIACVDNRGTGARGEQFKKLTYKQLGKYETEDQIAAARYLVKSGIADPNRIGIWGWSYGGYMSSLCVLKGSDVFKLAIAVAPVTNWRYYDTIYTERYMGLPQENASGYDDNSPINHVSKLKGKYLIVHGTADDNVHYQNALEMVSALNKAGKEYDMFIYPDKNHGISGGNTRMHLFNKLYLYITNNL